MAKKLTPEKALKLFQSQLNRAKEEQYAAMFSENPEVKLQFINNDNVYTDGTVIVADPASKHIYCDADVLKRTAMLLNWPLEFATKLVEDPWVGLKFVTRAQVIHECLHILYTDFPPQSSLDKKYKTIKEKQVIHHIENIIEDAYIENVGCTEYDNIDTFINFGRVSEGIAAEKMLKDRQVSVSTDQSDPDVLLIQYLDYMIGKILYPFMPQNPHSVKIEPYIQKTLPLFEEGIVASSPLKRYGYASRIYDVIKPLISYRTGSLDDKRLKLMLGDEHETSGSGEGKKGRELEVTQRSIAFKPSEAGDFDNGNNSRLEVALKCIWTELESDKEDAVAFGESSDNGEVIKGNALSKSINHKGVNVLVKYPQPDIFKRDSYSSVVNCYKATINKNNRQFRKLLHAYVPLRENKKLFGSAINSSRFGDVKRRYWYRNCPDIDIPDISVLLLIDGSGSMSGRKEKSARESAIILHEVLEKQGIPHAVIEHRGLSKDIETNVLFGFNAVAKDAKLNLMKINSYGNNRDGLALYWVGSYINKCVNSENKLIIVLSDGLPNHRGYYGQPAVADTAEAVKRLTKGGCHVIGISLEDDSYEDLKPIYPNLIRCSDLTKLPGQILGEVSRLIGCR